MNNDIRHRVVVEAVEGKCVRVRILQSSACASCHVSAHCGASEQKEKIIEIPDVTASGQYRTGDVVLVSVSQAVGAQAVLFGFVLPFLVLVTALFVSWMVTANETISAIISLCALIPYYFCVFLWRKMLRKKLTFRIEKQ